MRAAASAADIDVVAPNGSRDAEAGEGDDEDDEDEDASDISASAPKEEHEAEDSPVRAASERNGVRSASRSDHVGRSSLDAAERSSK